MTPRSFWELLADSLLLLKESFLEWAGIVAAGLLPGFLATGAATTALGLPDIASLKDAIATGSPRIVLPLLCAGILDKVCNLLAVLAVLRSAAARDEGHRLGLRRAYAEALPRLTTFIAAQARAFVAILWGLARLIVPGLRLCLFYAFVPAAAMTDAPGPAQALEASARAARVDPVKTAVDLAAALLLGLGAYSLLAFALTACMSFPTAAFPGGESILEAMLLGYVNELLGALVLGWLGAFSILLYRDFSQAQRPTTV